MANKMELELLLKLRDNMSRGMRSAINAIDQDTKRLKGNLDGVAKAADRIKPTGIQRMTVALLAMKKASQGALETLQKAAQVGVSVGSAGYVLKAASQKPMALDRRMALIANTAYSDQSAVMRIAGKERINAGIRNAVNLGGGTPDQAAETLNSLIASGVMGQGKDSIDKALRYLPTIQKVATGTGANPNDLAGIISAAIATQGLTVDDIPAILAKATKGGQLGGAEIADMAKQLPSQMALARGMTGMGGLESLIAANQVTRITAGSADEGGINLKNLLGKMYSPDTANDFNKLGIDLNEALAKARGKGIDPLVAFSSLIESQGLKDKKYVELKNRADNETGSAQKATLNAMSDILMQKGIGKVIQDQQAMLAALAMIQQKKKYEEILFGVHDENGPENEKSFATVSDTSDFKAEQLSNKAAFAALDTLNSIDEPLKRLLDGMNNVATAYPVLAQASYGAATALGVLAAAATSFQIFDKLKTIRDTPATSIKPEQIKAGAITPKLLVAAVPTVLAGYALKEGGEIIRNRFENSSDPINKTDKTAFAILKRNAEQQLKVTVEVKNGNVLASVNQENSRQASRH